MRLVSDVVGLVAGVGALAAAIYVWRTSRRIRRDMGDLKCPHCHKRIFPELP